MFVEIVPSATTYITREATHLMITMTKITPKIRALKIATQIIKSQPNKGLKSLERLIYSVILQTESLEL